MKRTLLQIVQEILNDMDSDEVNSIDDTMEAVQVAEIVRSTFFAMISNRDWPHTRKSLKFIASATQDRPTHLEMPEGVKEFKGFNYNKVKSGETRKRYEKIKYLYPDDFLRRQNALNSDSANVDVILDETGVELLIRNDKHPEYFTSFDDKTIVCDSYDKSVDSTLQNSKVQAMAYVIPDWEHLDEGIPDLPVEAFPSLIEKAKSKASLKLRQVADVSAQDEAGKQSRWLSRKARNINSGVRYPSYGRRGARRTSDSTFNRNN